MEIYHKNNYIIFLDLCGIKMQLYALNAAGQLILAHAAQKHQDYQCLECQARVRLRGGLHRQNHFFHLQPNHHCQLAGKGMVHLQIQQSLWEMLTPLGECQLEYRFPQIRRIADVAWMPHKIIFEIQCSPILAEEVKSRNRDYAQLGWQVIWILHDKLYNQRRLTAAEWILRSFPHYFTNFDKEGRGIIYDQFDMIHKGMRIRKMPPLTVNVALFEPLHSQLISTSYLKLVKQRLKKWPLGFQGDLVHLNQSTRDDSYIEQAKALEQEAFVKEEMEQKENYLKQLIEQFFIRPYGLLLQMLVEKMCR
jgi:competence protein CoiA